MAVIVAHEDGCTIVVLGPVGPAQVTGTSGYQDVATLCSCGGLYIRVPDPDPNPMDDAVIYTIAPEVR